MGRVLGDAAAVPLWLALTLAGLAATVVAGHAAWAVAGWALGDVAAIVVATIIVAAIIVAAIIVAAARDVAATESAPVQHRLARTAPPAEALADHQRRAAVATFSVTPTRADRLARR